MRNSNSLLSMVLIAGLFLACDAEVSTSDKDNFNKKVEVKGPKAQGHWISDCVESVWGAGSYRNVELSIEKKNVEYSERSFSDINCTQENRSQVETFKGTYSFPKKLSGDTYVFEMKIPISSNASQLKTLNLKRSDDVLLVSSFYSPVFDKASDYLPTLELRQVSKGEDVPEEVTLQSGIYRDVTDLYCDQSVSVVSSDEKLIGVYIEFISPCRGTLQFQCEGEWCYSVESDQRAVKVLSNKSYQFTDNDSSKVTFEQI